MTGQLIHNLIELNNFAVEMGERPAGFVLGTEEMREFVTAYVEPKEESPMFCGTLSWCWFNRLPVYEDSRQSYLSVVTENDVEIHTSQIRL